MSKKSIKDYLNVAQLEIHEPKHAEDNPRKLKQIIRCTFAVSTRIFQEIYSYGTDVVFFFFSVTIKTLEIFRTTENK